MSDAQPAQTEAARRAAARKAKILARGNTGLQKLAQTARGDEAELLYSESSTPRSPPSPAPRNMDTPPSWSPPNPANDATQPLPANQQAMSAQLESVMSMFGAPPGGSQDGIPDMQNLFAQMMGGMNGPGIGGIGGGGGQNLLGDLDDPAGLGVMGGMGGGGGLPPNFGQGMGMGLGEGGFPAFPGMSGVSRPRNAVDKFAGLIHVLGVVGLAIFVVGWWEPRISATRWTGEVLGGWNGRWSGLIGKRGLLSGLKTDILGGVESLPVFWAFVTLELIIQTTRIMILRSPPPPHSLISNFLPLLPLKLSRPILTASRCLTSATQIYKDGCLLIFLIGLSTIIANAFR